MTQGIFISFEGGEGTGKSTQASLLCDKLKKNGKSVIQTREPGGTPGAEKIRDLLVSGTPESWSPIAEALLMSAARDNHLRQCIIPAVDQGKIVVCDRFADSTRAYQGVASGVSVDLLKSLETHVVGEYFPDLTFMFDLDPELGLSRARERGDQNEDRFERKGLAYHQAIRKAFLDIANKFPKRCVIVDASLPINIIKTLVWQAVSSKFL